MSGEHVIVVSGSRGWTDFEFIRDRIERLPSPRKVLVGDAGGADQLVRRACRDLGIPCQVFRADWGTHGNRAGPLRNREMLNQTEVEMLVAFWIGTSRGTKDAFLYAMQRRLPVELHWRAA